MNEHFRRLIILPYLLLCQITLKNSVLHRKLALHHRSFSRPPGQEKCVKDIDGPALNLFTSYYSCDISWLQFQLQAVNSNIRWSSINFTGC